MKKPRKLPKPDLLCDLDSSQMESVYCWLRHHLERFQKARNQMNRAARMEPADQVQEHAKYYRNAVGAVRDLCGNLQRQINRRKREEEWEAHDDSHDGGARRGGDGGAADRAGS